MPTMMLSLLLVVALAPAREAADPYDRALSWKVEHFLGLQGKAKEQATRELAPTYKSDQTMFARLGLPAPKRGTMSTADLAYWYFRNAQPGFLQYAANNPEAGAWMLRRELVGSSTLDELMDRPNLVEGWVAACAQFNLDPVQSRDFDGQIAFESSLKQYLHTSKKVDPAAARVEMRTTSLMFSLGGADSLLATPAMRRRLAGKEKIVLRMFVDRFDRWQRVVSSFPYARKYYTAFGNGNDFQISLASSISREHAQVLREILKRTPPERSQAVYFDYLRKLVKLPE